VGASAGLLRGSIPGVSLWRVLAMKQSSG